jgi:DNA sulfur modification protein DndE
MTIESIRLGQQSRDQLIRLKRITAIDNWNVLCRWAFCLSIADKNRPPGTKMHGEAAIEMSWKTFAGEQSDVYLALLLQRAHEEEKATSRESLSELLRLHVTRGIGLLTARRQMNGIGDLLALSV